MSQRRFVSSLLVLVVAGLPLMAQEADLTWKFEKDKTFYETMTTTTKQVMKVQGNDVNQDQTQVFYFSWTPKEVTPEKVVLAQKIIGLKMNITIGGSKISYDSTAKQEGAAANPLNKFFDSLKDAEFEITLDPKTMKVTDIAKHDDFVKKLGEANPQMKPLLDKILSKKAMQDMAEPLFAAVPGGKKTKGAEWKRDTTLDMGPIGSYKTDYTYKFDSVDKDNAKVGVTTALKYTAPTDPAGSALPFKIKTANLAGKDGTGEVIFDTKAGMVKSSKLSQKLEGNLEIEISGQGTPVTLNQDQTTDIQIGTTNPVQPAK